MKLWGQCALLSLTTVPQWMQCVTENRSVTRVDALVAQSGQEVPSAGGNVRPLPGPLVRVTGGELAVDGRPIETT